MTSLDKSSLEVLLEGRDRDHVIFWFGTDSARHKVIGEFIEAAGERGDLIAIAMCLGDFENLEKAISNKLHNLDDLIGRGNLMLFVSCEFLPRKDNGHIIRTRDTFAKLEGKAEAEKRGLRLIGTVPLAAMAAGDTEGCLELERIGNESLKNGRLLCLYDTRLLPRLTPEDMSRLNALHSHVLVESRNGKVVNSVTDPGRAHKLKK